MKTKATYLFALLLSCFGFSLSAQNSVNGAVRAADNNEPLIGVTVLSLPSGNGALTDFDGKFTLNTGMDDSLRFSYIGYQTQTFPIVAGKTDYSFSMTSDVNLVDEVVIIGYGKVKKSDLTGSVSSVKSEELQKVPTANALQALQGKVSGLSVLTTSGDPGATPVVRLRGITTLNDNNPIVVIDGVISDVGAMNLLNANDIESVEVLKDASSTAIYGSRGAAGVIIVTTKRGSSLENSISVSLDQSFESVANQVGVMNGREFATYINEINPGTFNNVDALPDTDWQDLIYQDFAPITNANLSASGATDQARYYLGLGYFGQGGIIPKSGLDRLTAKINSGYDLTKNVRFGLDLSIALTDKDNAPGVVNTALRAWPVNSPFNEDGTFAEVEGSNPLATIEYTNSKTQSLLGLGNLYAEVDFLEHFRFKTSAQFDFGTSRSKSFTPVFFVAPLQQNEMNALNVGYGNRQTLIWENILGYNNTFGMHSVDVIAGYSAQSQESEFLNGSTRNLLREDPSFWYLNAGEDEFEVASNGSSRNTLLSYLGRANYSYDGRYLFTATFRRDGSSKFGVNNRYGNFTSYAVGWNLSNESFFPENNLFSNVKLRASYGSIGNERIPGDAQYSLISSGQNAVFGDYGNGTIYPGASYSSGGNPFLKWEQTQQTDIGVEFGLFENRILAEIDYYYKRTNDILVNLEPIGYTGIGSFQSIFYNAADVQNQGFDWNLTYRSDASKEFTYELGFLGSTVSNRVLDLGQGIGADSLLVGGDLGNGQRVSRSSVGQPIGYFYGYQVEGVFQNQAELESSPVLFGQAVGDLKYTDINGDGKIDGKDRTRIGNSIPSFIFGFNASASYRNLSLSADIQGQTGNDIYNGKQAVRFALLNYEEKYNDRWTGEGSTNEHFIASPGGTNFTPSSYFVEDGSFIRLRNLTLSYDLSQRLLDQLKINNARFYIRGTNLLTLTRFTGYSPDIGAGNATSGVIDLGSYPITRVFSFGFNFNL